MAIAIGVRIAINASMIAKIIRVSTSGLKKRPPNFGLRCELAWGGPARRSSGNLRPAGCGAS
ncbi:MAG: hypothetical protein ABIN37_18105, partial [Burkholderiaceae bacterium]